MKFIKKLIILIVLLLIIVCLIGYRNYNIIDKIIEKSNEYSMLQNYSYEIHNIKPTEDKYEIYKKDNITIYLSEENRFFMDEELGTTTITNLETNEKTVVEQIVYKNKIPLVLEGNFSVFDKILFSMNVNLKTEEINGKKCYVIENKKENQKTYVYADRYLLAKQITNNTEIEYLNWKVNGVTYTFVNKNFTTIIEETNNEIAENEITENEIIENKIVKNEIAKNEIVENEVTNQTVENVDPEMLKFEKYQKYDPSYGVFYQKYTYATIFDKYPTNYTEIMEKYTAFDEASISPDGVCFIDIESNYDQYNNFDYDSESLEKIDLNKKIEIKMAYLIGDSLIPSYGILEENREECNYNPDSVDEETVNKLKELAEKNNYKKTGKKFLDLSLDERTAFNANYEYFRREQYENGEYNITYDFTGNLDFYYSITGMMLLNGKNGWDVTDDEWNDYARAKKIKVNIEDKEYIFDVKDTKDAQIFGVEYYQDNIQTPIDIEIEVLEIYEGEKSNDLYIYDIQFGFDTDLRMGR